MNQSAPNLVKMYMTIRSRMSSNMELIKPELFELSTLVLENLPHLTSFTLVSAKIDQSVPNLATIFVLIKSQMSSITGQIETEHAELFALEFGKIYFVICKRFPFGPVYKFVVWYRVEKHLICCRQRKIW